MIQLFAFTAKAADKPPILVELFTSEGCSSCPPAEALLNELSTHKDVVTIAYHVTYWDYLGWKDKFATVWGTDRQKSYARFLRSRTVYTPQMVIDGRYHEVGSKRHNIAELINLRQNDTQRVTFQVKKSNDTDYQVNVLKSGFSGKLPGKVEIVAVYFIGPQETKVQAGENRGKILRHQTIAKKMEVIGNWNGKKEVTEYIITPPAGADIEGVALFAQTKPIGFVIGARKHIF
ncbi:MAG: DUF1223 domain-containing protein [Alphaproteobacteria bacterium]|nr:DUF1223 domain-containing protein [Alphaproteobacteria bacterium]